MESDNLFRGKKVLVMGAARSGVSAVKLLSKAGAKITLTDQKPISELDFTEEEFSDLNQVTLHLGGHLESDFTSHEVIVISPGVPSDHDLVNSARVYGARVISEIELAYLFFQGQILGITGTNGKTTVTTLTGEILNHDPRLKSKVAGNIGYPFTTAVLEHPETKFMVTEISSFQLENIFDFKVRAGVILNIDPDHMDRYRSLEEYAETKAKLFNNQEEDDWAIINHEDNFRNLFKESTPANLIEFSSKHELTRGLYLKDNQIMINLPQFKISDTVFLTINEIKLKGNHNLENVMASIALGLVAGIDLEKIRETVRNFKGLPHRIEFIDSINGVEFYNDSKATNVSAVLRAIEMFNGRDITLILGGSDKNLDFSPLLDPVKKHVKKLILIGETAPKLEKIFNNHLAYDIAGSMTEAVALGLENTSPGGVVLLSPACASFDWFKNYKDRGDTFRREVEILKQERKHD